MSEWEALLAAIRSGQLSPAQEAAEMTDSNFAAYRAQRCEVQHGRTTMTKPTEKPKPIHDPKPAPAPVPLDGGGNGNGPPPPKP